MENPLKLENMYTLLSIDAWKTEDGWDWNQWFKVEQDIYFHEPSTRLVLKKMREWDYLTKESIGKLEVYDDGYNLVIQNRLTQEPIYALEPQW